jgi:uncharacterized protein (TIGR00304 family)
MMKTIIIGLMLLFIGTLIVLAGIFGMVYQAGKIGEKAGAKPETRSAGIVMIGPIPIIFGTDMGALKIVMILAIALMIIAAVFLFLPLRMV